MRWLSALMLLGLAALAWTLTVRPGPTVQIQNRSGLRIESMEIVVGDHEAASLSLGGQELARQIVPVRQEGPVRLRIDFEGLPPRELDVGWFVPGQRGVPTFVIVSPDSAYFVAD